MISALLPTNDRNLCSHITLLGAEFPRVVLLGHELAREKFPDLDPL